MDRGIFQNISKINTFISMSKTNDYIHSYVEKIFNKKNKNINFKKDFDITSINLLYSSLELMTYKGDLTTSDYNKLDKKELKYHINNAHGIDYFTKQVTSLKTDKAIVNCIKKSLEEGSFICSYNNTVLFDNGLVVDSKWLIDFVNFLVESLEQNRFVSKDCKKYLYRHVDILDNTTNYNEYIKNIKIYEYSVYKNNKANLSLANIKYLNDLLGCVNDYEFDELKNLNTTLSKEGFTLSISKSNPTFNSEQKSIIKNMLNEQKYDLLKQFINDILNSANSSSNTSKKRCLSAYKNIKMLSYAYKNEIDLDICREKFDYLDYDSLIGALYIGDIYINYIYDENDLNKNLNYELLKLEDIKPEKIDYETNEYKKIINELSNLNKKLVGQNRKINRFLSYDKEKRKKYDDLLEQSCNILDKTLLEIEELRKILENEKENILTKYNINKMKIKYIKDAIISGNYINNRDHIEFFVINDKYNESFHLEMPLEEFITCIISDYNKNIRINVYLQ